MALTDVKDIKTILNDYLVKNHPSIALAIAEIRLWFRDRQTAGDIHAYSVYCLSQTMIVDVQITSTGPTHTLQFTESVWMNSGASSPNTQTILVPSHKGDIKRKQETPEEKYDRAMRGV